MGALLHVFRADKEIAKLHNIEKDKWYFWDLNFRNIMGSGYNTFEAAAADFAQFYNQNFKCPNGACEE